MQTVGRRVGVDDAVIPARAAPPASRLAWNRLDLLWVVVVAALLGAGMLKSQGAFSYQWDWSSVWPYFVKTDSLTGQWAPNLLLQGLMTTLRLALWGMLIATLVGLIMGWMRNHSRMLLRMVVLFGPMDLINNFFLGLVCLSVFSGAYVTEIVRAGLYSVPRGQTEAARSLGMTNLDIMFRVVWPQALRNVLPSLTGQFIQLIKDSSLVSLVSIQELSFMAQDVQVSTQRVFEVFVLTAVIYFCICFSLSQAFAYLERRHSRTN